MGQTPAHLNELALALIHDRLPENKKESVYRLVLYCPEFISVLKEEVMFANELQVLKREAPEPVKRRVYRSISENLGEAVVRVVFCKIFKAILPDLPWPLEEIFKRSVFVNE